MPTLPLSATGIAERLSSAISKRIGEPRYNLWFRNHTKFTLDDDTIVVGVPNLYFHDWLQKTFGEDVKAAVHELFGDGVGLRFLIDADLFQAHRAAERDVQAQTQRPATPKATESKRTTSRPKPASNRRWRTLSDFVVGPCNRVALASAISAVEEPGLGANPLVIYGPTGTGKTHLLEGVYVGLKRRHSDARIVFTSAEEFMNRFLAAVHQGKQESFRRHYRDAFAFLIDDLSFLVGKKATQVEFLHTFDSIVGDGRLMVVTADCHPRLTDDLMPELADRLLGGAVWGVLPPEPETRLSILRSKSSTATPAIPEDVLQFLANNLRGNVRELEGAIHSLRHFARVTERPVTREVAREALGDLLRHAVRVVHIADVESAVCSALKMPSNALRSKSKTWSVSHARMLAIFLSRKHTSATFGEIGVYFGNKTHSTAVAAEKKVRGWLQTNQAVKAGDREWKARDLIDRVERELTER